MPQTQPKITDNLVEVINYTNPESDAKETKQDLINRENCEVKNIPQAELASKYENWNWIKHSPGDLELYAKYLANSQSLEIYYNHEKAQKEFGDRFWFDGGTKLDSKNLLSSNEGNCWKVLDRKLSDFYKFYLKPNFSGFLVKEGLKIDFPQGSQGLKIFSPKYKIVWNKVFRGSYQNYSFTDVEDLLFADNQIMLISSNSRFEILYLFSLLNSSINLKILDLTSNAGNYEQLGTLTSITAIKNFIRIPILNTPQKLEQKQKLIQLAQGLLDAETVALQDLVDFDDDRVLPARFGKWEVSNGDTVVASTIILDSTYKFPIKNQPDLIKQTLEKEIGNSEFSLNQLKNLNVFDKNHQTKIKNQIDELVLGMYQI